MAGGGTRMAAGRGILGGDEDGEQGQEWWAADADLDGGSRVETGTLSASGNGDGGRSLETRMAGR